MPCGDIHPPPLCPFCGSTYPHDCTTTKRMMDEARKPTPPPRTQWEYRVIRRPITPDKVNDECDRLGADGWELAACPGAVWVFKRPVQP